MRFFPINIPNSVELISVNNVFTSGSSQFNEAITDYATFAYLADIYVEDQFRGKGYSKIIVKALLDKSGSQELRRVLLATADAHGLYRKFDFTNLAQPETFLEINRPNIYQQ